MENLVYMKSACSFSHCGFLWNVLSHNALILCILTCGTSEKTVKCHNKQNNKQKTALLTHKCNLDPIKLFLKQFIIEDSRRVPENVKSINMANSVIDPTVSCRENNAIYQHDDICREALSLHISPSTATVYGLHSNYLLQGPKLTWWYPKIN